MDKSDCVFCKIVEGSVSVEQIASSKNFIAILDVHPKVNGHTLIIPREHYVNILDLPDTLGNELVKFSKQVAKNLMDKDYGNGFQLVMNNFPSAGQVVMHAHLHVLPRKEKDEFKSHV